MKKRTLTFILTTRLITGLLSACGNSSTSDSVTVPSNNSSQKSEVICLTDTVAESVNIDYSINTYAPVNDFGYRLFQESLDGTTNPVLSPVSAYIALTMAGNGANGATKDEFLKLLGENGEMTTLSDDMINTMVKKEEYYYIKINNEEYQVVGIYEPVADKADVCFAYFPQTEYQFEEFCRNFIDNIFSISNMKWGIFGVYIGSENSFDINEIDEFISELEKISDTTFDIKVIDRSIASPNEKIKVLIIIYVLLLFFCIVVYIQVIDMFTKKRYKDYVIYRACGCNCNMIARRLFMEMLPMFICSFIAVFIANSVYNVWLTDSVWYSISYEGVAFMAGTSVVLVYMSIFIIIMKLRRINLAEGIMDL